MDALVHRFPDLPHPVTYDAVEELVTRLRDDLSIAERALADMRGREIAALEQRLAELRAAGALAVGGAPPDLGPCPHCGALKPIGRALSQHAGHCPQNPNRKTATRASRAAVAEEPAPKAGAPS
jgi:hypothetical protein